MELNSLPSSRVNDFLFSKNLPFKAVDVTWRYSPKHDEICQRRLMVSEEWLVRTLSMLNWQVSNQTCTKLFHENTMDVKW